MMLMIEFHVIYEKFKNITKNLNIKLSFFSLIKLDEIIKAQKDSLEHNSKKKFTRLVIKIATPLI